MSTKITPGATTATVVQYNPAIIGPVPTPSEMEPGPQPILIQCPLCYEKVVTVIKHQNTCKTHGLASCICLFGGIICCLIPYSLKAYNKIEHYCPNCNGLLGVYNT